MFNHPSIGRKKSWNMLSIVSRRQYKNPVKALGDDPHFIVDKKLSVSVRIVGRNQ